MVTRRTMLATTALAAAAYGMPAMRAAAQDATPEADESGVGYAIARVRGIASPELAQAIYADALTNFLPANREVDGYRGYAIAFLDDDPTGQITLSLLADESAVAASGDVSAAYVAQVDPRFEVELRDEQTGRMRVWLMSDRTRSELPPNLAGCAITLRERISADGIDFENIVAMVASDLAPQLAAMEGFVLYGLLQTDTGRVGINIWETAEQLAAGNEAVAAWTGVHTIGTWVGDPVIYDGAIGYAEIVGWE